MNTDISSMDIKEAFLIFTEYRQDLEGEELDEYDEVYELVRFGTEVEFDLYDYIYDMMNFSKSKSGKVLYRGKVISLTDFWTEIEERNNQIKRWIKENDKDQPLAIGYGLRK